MKSFLSPSIEPKIDCIIQFFIPDHTKKNINGNPIKFGMKWIFVTVKWVTYKCSSHDCMWSEIDTFFTIVRIESEIPNVYQISIYMLYLIMLMTAWRTIKIDFSQVAIALA